MRFILPALIVLIFDQVSKQFFWHLGRNFDVIDSLMRITLVKNSGAAFGIFQNGRIFLVISSVIASMFIIFLAPRVPAEDRAKRFYLGMILGGALGNLVDRIHPGQVIDFIDMGLGAYRWPVYNISDAAVTVGGALLIFSYSHRSDAALELPPAGENRAEDRDRAESE